DLVLRPEQLRQDLTRVGTLAVVRRVRQQLGRLACSEVRENSLASPGAQPAQQLDSPLRIHASPVGGDWPAGIRGLPGGCRWTRSPSVEQWPLSLPGEG